MTTSRTRTANPLATKRGNYLLRSRYAGSLRQVVALANAGRIRESAHGLPSIVNADGDWAGNCGWEVAQLVNRGLLERIQYLDPKAPVIYGVTRAGTLALEAALDRIGRRVGTVTLLAEVDARRSS